MAASGLSGGARPTGVDSTHLKNWLLRYKVSSERLRQEMAEWVELLNNSMPDYAAYRAHLVSEQPFFKVGAIHP